MNDNFDMDVVADQIGVIGSGIMGLSVGCARCHDHKHDPIPARDYYALAGIFKSTETLWGAAAYRGAHRTADAAARAAGCAESAAASGRGAAERRKAVEQGSPPSLPSRTRPTHRSRWACAKRRPIADCKLNIDGESKKLGASIPRGFLSACGAADGDLDRRRSKADASNSPSG